MFDKLPAEKKKNYLSCAKIASLRKGCRPTEKGRRSTGGFTLFAFERQDGITFSCRYRDINAFGTTFADQFKYKLKLRKSKSGEIRFVFYNLSVGGHQGGVRTASPNYMRSKMMRICLDQERARKNPRTELVTRGLYAAQERRLLTFLRAFLKKHEVSIKGLSKDPFSLMVQLCYPGASGFDEEVLRKLSVGSLLLDDPLKLTLRTKGKASKRLLLGAIKQFPGGSQTILKVAKYLRVNRSLDEAQKFLEILSRTGNDLRTFNDECDYQYSVKKLTAKQMKILDPLSIESICAAIENHEARIIFNDIFTMIEQCGGDNGFNIAEVRYRTLRELHDALAVLQPKRTKNKFNHYEFATDSAPMRFCKALAENFSDEEYAVCYPAGTEELLQYANAMHNCAFFYHERIRKGEYAIFCFKANRLELMFGVTFHTTRVLPDGRKWTGLQLVRADQAVGHCNAKIEREIEDRLNLKIEQAVKDSFAFWHRTPPGYENWLPQDFT